MMCVSISLEATYVSYMAWGGLAKEKKMEEEGNGKRDGSKK